MKFGQFANTNRTIQGDVRSDLRFVGETERQKREIVGKEGQLLRLDSSMKELHQL